MSPGWTPQPQRNPVVGWRLWYVRDGRLHSWNVDYFWQKGPNKAECRRDVGTGCPDPPGKRCQCGLWGVWKLSDALNRVLASTSEDNLIVGVISGWGDVALHGGEGFRSEYAKVRCLFTDRPWLSDPSYIPLKKRSFLSALFGRSQAPPAPPTESELGRVAEYYRVPLLSIARAADLGFLGEIGMEKKYVKEALA